MDKDALQTEIAKRKAADVAYWLLSDYQIEQEILEERELAQRKVAVYKNQQNDGRQKSSNNLSTACRDWFQNWYAKLGFTISIPLPPVSDKEFNQRQELGQAIFYRPPTSDLSAAPTAQAGVSYEALMQAVGQGEHWTLTDKGDRKKIVWKPTKEGYWFWAEVAQECPRLGTSWNILTGEQKLNLLSLEEYVIVWWAHKADTNTLLDIKTRSWLRTRFGQSALRADEFDGRVGVDGYWLISYLSDSYDPVGGRAAEVVKDVT